MFFVFSHEKGTPISTPLLYTDAIFNVGVQINLIDMSSSGREEVALATSVTSTKLEDNVSSILGHKFLGTLTAVDLPLDDLLKQDDNIYNWGIKGLVSTNPRGDTLNRTVNYYTINGRVVEMPKVTSVLRRIWNGFGGRKKPSCLLSFTLPNNVFDINLSPDKQQVLLTHEQEICQLIETYVTKFWSSQTQGTFELQQLETPYEEEEEKADDTELDDDGERQMHKRRFAFVHDLAKAKLQHDSDDRQRCDEVVLHKQSKHQAEKTSRLDLEKECESTRTVLPVAAAELPRRISSDAAAPNQDPPLPACEKVSDMERRQWTALRAKFNASDEHNPHYRMAPVSPDDQPEEGNAPGSPPRVSTKSNRRGTAHKAKLTDVSHNHKQTSLKQFAFQPLDNVNTTRRTRASSSGPAQHSPAEEDDTELPPRKSRRLTGRLRETEESLDAKVPVGHDSVTTRESHESSEDEEVVSEDDGKGGATPSPDKKPLPVKLEENSIEPVTWTSFKSTEEVCRNARIQRTQMLRRKYALRGIHHSTFSSQELDEETKAVTNSVGIGDIAKPSRISLSKEQFRHEIQVIGQFNMGFILARCKDNHLWILDQHACDEKYNFENLCRDTIIHEQKLLRPMPLDLSPAEETCILDNMRIFEANGFRFHFDSSAPMRCRLSLTALPHSGARDGRKAVQFTKDDVTTLCSILTDGSSYEGGDGGTGTDGTGSYGNNAVRRYASTTRGPLDAADKVIARLPKAIAMFASRACRSSIMIGTALSHKEMEKVVQRLADVEHPWNCPHGRPTMRHVGEILPSLQFDERRAAEYYTDPTVTITPMTQEANADDQQDA